MAEMNELIPTRFRYRNIPFLESLLQLQPASRRMALALFLWGMGEGMWMFVRPLYVASLGGSPAQAGQVLAVAGLAPVLLMIPAGRLIDRTGPRILMLSTWWIGTIAAVMLALAPQWQWLMLGFFVYAVSATSIPAIDAYVARDAQQAAGETRASARTVQAVISAVFAAYFAGTILSPMIGGWLGEQFGLRTVYWVSAGWFFLSTLVISSTPDLPEYHTKTTPSESVHEEPSTPWWQFSAGQWRVYLTLLVLFLAISVGYTLIPSYLEDVRALPVGIVGSLGTATALGGMIWMLVLGRYHSRVALGIAALLMGLGFLGLLVFPDGALLLPGMIVVYFTMGIYLTVRTLSLGVASEYATPDQHGTAFGMVETVFGIGSFVGPWLAGLLYTGDPARPFIVALLVLLPLAGIVWLLLRPPATDPA